jgi:septal ring factor EnvC (AmiA/AmiB activator)
LELSKVEFKRLATFIRNVEKDNAQLKGNLIDLHVEVKELRRENGQMARQLNSRKVIK